MVDRMAVPSGDGKGVGRVLQPYLAQLRTVT